MNILFFDTETNGLPQDYSAPVNDGDNWPRMLQIGWKLTDGAARVIEEYCEVIQHTDPIDLDLEAVGVHGLTARDFAQGVPLDLALARFAAAVSQADMLVAHNISFDKKIIAAEFHRIGNPFSYSDGYRQSVCTMHASTKYCQLPKPSGRGGYKFPRLEELSQILFGLKLAPLHDAKRDVDVLAECFFELVNRNVIVLREGV